MREMAGNYFVQGAQLEVHRLPPDVVLEVKKAIRRGSCTRLNTVLGQVRFRLPANADAHSLVRYAVRKRQAEILTKLILCGAPVTGFDSPGQDTVLHLAAREYSKRLLGILLQHEVNKVAINARGETPLHLAMKMNHTEVVYDLLQLLASENQFAEISDCDGLSLFHIICSGTDSSYAARYLQAERATPIDVNKAVSRSSTFCPGLTALHFAACNYRLDTVRLLIDRGVDLSVKVGNGLNALHLVCGMDDLAKQLIDAVMTINPADDVEPAVREARLLASLQAAMKRRHQLAELLLNCYEVDARDADGNSALMHVVQNAYPTFAIANVRCYSSSTTADARRLAESARLREMLEDGQTAMAELLLKRHSSAGKGEVRFGEPLNFANNRGRTCLHRLAEVPNVSARFLHYLLRRGADVHAVDADGKTPLHVAAEVGNCSFIESLTAYKESRWEKMANVNARDNRGDTPLRLIRLSAKKTDECLAQNKCFCLLLQAGADVYVEEGKDEAKEFSSEVRSYVLRMMANEHFAEVLKLYEERSSKNASAYMIKAIKSRVILEIVDSLWRYLEMMHACSCFNLKLHYHFRDKLSKKFHASPESAQRAKCFAISCEKEVARMKEVKVNDRVTLYDVANKNPEDLLGCVQDDSLERLLEQSSFRDEFKIYGKTLEARCVEALNKRLRKQNLASCIVEMQMDAAKGVDEEESDDEPCAKVARLA